MTLPAELPVSDDIEIPIQDMLTEPHARAHMALDFDDAFSLQDDDAVTAAFEFTSDSFLKELHLRPSTGADEDDNDEVEEPSHDPADASVSTRGVDGVVEPHERDRHSAPLSPPPHPSSSSQSLSSEAQPRTPPDVVSSSSTHITSQFTNITLSPPQNVSSHSIQHDVESQDAYPNVIIDASKTPSGHSHSFPSSTSHRTIASHTSSRSSASEYAAESPSKEHRPTQSVSSSGHPSSSAPTVPKITRSSGPSALQQVVSKTRPPHLPPKQKEEDEKHTKEWEEMMERSRAADRKRQEALEVRRQARELSVEANTSLWQRSVISDWKNAVRNPQLRKLWWNGVPTKLRSFVWERAVGNALALSKDTYTSTLARAKNLLATNRFPGETLVQLERDISRTLPQLHIFNHVTGPLYDDLRDLLCAWVVSRADEGLGYVDGIARIGGMFLLNLTGPAQAFNVMRNFLETGCMRAFYGGPGSRDDVEAYYRIFDTLLADGMPKVYFNFKQHQISPSSYLPDWLLPVFLDHLPLEACSRIWDVLLLEGDPFLFRAALAMLACLESRLFFPDRTELLTVLKGESSAAMQVALRSAGQSPITNDGGVAGPRYEIYGINEENLWERVMEMEEWFKESTWRRLIQRELPDL